MLVILEMGSYRLFAWPGLKPWSSWSQLGLQICATGAQLTSPFFTDKFSMGSQGVTLPQSPIMSDSEFS
jgi:hypothetical protein